MIAGRRIVVVALLSLATAGCNTGGNVPLVFVQSQTVGITANASGSQATPELTVGYRDVDVALVPVVSGDTPLKASIIEKGNHYDDALSVIGQFNVGSTTATPSANLGKFFATGMAAKKLADGFSKQLAGTATSKAQQ